MSTHSFRVPLRAAVLCFGLLSSGPTWADVVLATPAGLKPGDTFRVVFVTDGARDATSTDIADYNSFVNAQAGGATYNGSVVNWSVIGSTSDVAAIDNVGQTETPIYLVDGTLVTTSTTSAGLWSGTLLHAIDESITGANVHTSVWTGTTADGLGSIGKLGAPFIIGGFFDLGVDIGVTFTEGSNWISGALGPETVGRQFYGISEVLTVSARSVPEPSSLSLMGTALGAGAFWGWNRRRGVRRSKMARAAA